MYCMQKTNFHDYYLEIIEDNIIPPLSSMGDRS